MLSPVECMVLTTFFLASVIPFDSCLKFTRNRMVMSMAMPNATLKTKTVEGFMATPAHPIIPAVIIKGTTFGIREHNKMRNDLKR